MVLYFRINRLFNTHLHMCIYTERGREIMCTHTLVKADYQQLDHQCINKLRFVQETTNPCKKTGQSKAA